MAFLSRSGAVAWLIVGLGNIGDKYEHTRHNVGFDTLDALAQSLDVSVRRLKFKALIGTTELAGQTVLLMKPVTFMNLSGEAVEQATSFYRLPPERVLVISDDVALPPGKLRIRPSGSAGGHNGHKNIALHLHSENYPRVRIGVGCPPQNYDMIEWVLGRPQLPDQEAIHSAILRAVSAIEVILREGPEKAMNQYNG